MHEMCFWFSGISGGRIDYYEMRTEVGRQLRCGSGEDSSVFVLVPRGTIHMH